MRCLSVKWRVSAAQVFSPINWSACSSSQAAIKALSASLQPGASKTGRGATRKQDIATQRAATKELAAVERKLASIPAEIDQVNVRLAEHDQRDYMGVAAHLEALKSLESRLSDLETRWLELTEQLEGAS